MIRYIRHTDIDLAKWDACISSSINGIIYAYSWYLDVVCENWDALIEDDYSSVFPIAWSQKGGIKYVYQPPFTQQLGIFSLNPISPEKLQAYIESIPKEYKLIEINLNKYNQIGDYKASTVTMNNYELDLIGDYSSLRAGYSSNHLRNIDKAYSAGLAIIPAVQPEQIIELFRKNKGDSMKLYSERQYKILHRLIHQLIQQSKAKAIGVRNARNEVVAGAFFLYSHKRIIFLFSGRDTSAQEPGIMHFLLDQCICEHAGEPITLDFEGSNNEGLGRFYAGFGAQLFHYTHLKINRLPYLFKILVTLGKRIISL